MGFKPRSKRYFVKFPIILSADDYHEFSSYQDVLSLAIGENVQYEELDNLHFEEKYYSAVFFVDRTKEVDDIVSN